jgi:molybdopterin-guanine dinucleotide biosynthesis protein A
MGYGNTQDAPEKRGAVILAGGRSSRMGQAKALLPIDGKPLIAHLVQTFTEMFADIVVAAAPEQELPPLPVALVRDEIAYQGPVSGIYHGLSAARCSLNFVVSCDILFPSISLISYLLSQADGYEAVVPYWEQRFQPLFAVYRKTVVPFLQDQLQRGELRPVFLYEKVPTRKVAEEEIRRFDPEGLSFLNMNTPEDYQSALNLWRNSGRGSAPGAEAICCTVELFGVARLRAKTATVALELPREATLGQVFLALAERLPSLVGYVIAPDKTSLVSGHACNINGRSFVHNSGVKITSGDRIFLISADAGG